MNQTSKDIAKATSDMMQIAQKAGEFKDRRETMRQRSRSTFGVSGSVIQRLEQQTAILRLEKQLKEAREKLAHNN